MKESTNGVITASFDCMPVERPAGGIDPLQSTFLVPWKLVDILLIYLSLLNDLSVIRIEVHPAPHLFCCFISAVVFRLFTLFAINLFPASFHRLFLAHPVLPAETLVAGM